MTDGLDTTAAPPSTSGPQAGVGRRFRAERAVSPLGRTEQWVVIDAALVAHREATDYLRALAAADRSPHTIRAYAGRVALFLSWCDGEGVEWRTVSLSALGRFKQWLETTPGAWGRTRSGATVNAVLTATCELLRHCARVGVVDAEVAERLSQPRWLRVLPPGFDPGEEGQFRTVAVRAVKARATTPFPEALTPDQSRAVLERCRRPRERFTVVVLLHGGLRIGEALGLRREDMHLLPDSRAMGCGVVGPHLHVRRRANPNGALVKSRHPRTVPASDDLVAAYADYRYERAAILGDDDSDLVLVNLYHRPLGAPMTYRGAKRFFDRLARQCGFPVRPHMLRHSAATSWVRAGVDLDVVQRLLGHASLGSTSVYLHAADEDCRRAVEAVAAGERWR